MNALSDFSAGSLDAVMPMHLCLDTDGVVTHIGPTLAKVCNPLRTIGKSVFDTFAIRRPHTAEDMDALNRLAGQGLRLQMHDAPRTTFKGILARQPGARGYILNLSFGIGVIDAVGTYELSGADFAPTDLTIEMLYLQEAKSAVFEKSRKLNFRLEGARVEAEVQAMTDTLTGLKNRRAMDEALSNLIARRESFGLMHLDLDYFKDVNDTLGHAAGDFVLERVAEVFETETRAEDTVSRVGGDEFVLILYRLVDVKRLREIAERIIARLEQPISFEGKICRVSVSIGATISSRYQEPTADEILRHADRALYASKGAGRARFTLYSEAIETGDAGDATPGGRDDITAAG